MKNQSELVATLQKNKLPFTINEPLKAHTTFKIGGIASVFCAPQTFLQLEKTLQACKEHKVRYYLLGKGSNMLFADEGFDGVVIHIGEVLERIEVQGNRITAFAGTSLSKVCKAAAEHSLTGLEFAFGIPGNVGGAVYMNAGAYGGEMKDVVESVCFYDEMLVPRELPNAALCFGYRTSVFETNPWCIQSATFVLQVGDAQEIKALMADYAQRRADKQPLDVPSAGSTFKRPQGAFAGALIDQCGLRGYTVGGAAISEKHCGFVVNIGGATCADVLALTGEVCSIVTRETGVVLEKEVRVVK